MNRAEKRKQLAKSKKKAEFAKQLTPVQKEYISEMVELTKQNVMLQMADIFDVVMTGALVEHTNLSMKEIFNINMTSGQFMGEIQKQNYEIGVEQRKMNLKKIEKEGIEIIEDLMRAGKARGEIVKELRLLYKGTGITTAEINCAYKQVEEKLEGEAAEYNFVEEKAIEEVKEEIKVEPTSGFEVISKSIEVKGQYGQYKIHDNAMTIDGTVVSFKEESDIKDWYKAEREELEKKIALLNAKEEEAIQALNKFM